MIDTITVILNSIQDLHTLATLMVVSTARSLWNVRGFRVKLPDFHQDRQHDGSRGTILFTVASALTKVILNLIQDLHAFG